MKQRKQDHEILKKIVAVGLLTALAAVFSMIKIPVASTATVTLVLPIVVIGAALYGPIVGAWLTVIPTITSFGEATLFLTYSPIGTGLTLFLKGILAGLCAGLVYKVLSRKHPLGAVTCAGIVAPVVNSGVFVLGCYIFIWDELMALAAANGVGIAMLLLGLVVINFVLELILNIILCPSIFRVIQIVTKKHTR